MTSTRLPLPVTVAPETRLPVAVAALVGLLSMAAGLATGHLVGGLISPTASPFLAVGSSAIDLTPLWLKDFAVRTFGSYDKVVLLSGMAVVVALVGVAAGLLSRRSRTPGLIVLVGTRRSGQCRGIVPSHLAVRSMCLLRWLRCSPVWARSLRCTAWVSAASSQRAVRRRGCLAVRCSSGQRRSPPVLASLRPVVSCWPGAVVSRPPARQSGGSSPPWPHRRSRAWRTSPLKGHPPSSPRTEIFTGWTSTSHCRNCGPRTGGYGCTGWSIGSSLSNWAELTSRQLIERPVTMTCVSNEVGGPYISTANFTGVLLADILSEAGVRQGADQVFTTSVDGVDLRQPRPPSLADPGRQAMLVIGMNGEPLPIEHGFPVRMLVPGLYGFVSGTKWITDMELTTFDAQQAYWLQRGWGQRAPIKTMSRIDSPGAFGRVSQTVRSRASRGRRPEASSRSRCASTTASGDPPSCPLRSTWTRGECSGCAGGGNLATTSPRSARQTRPGTPRPRIGPPPSPTAPVDGIRYSSPSSENDTSRIRSDRGQIVSYS